MNKVSFVRAELYDAKALIEVRTKSFYADYMKYGECPGYHRTMDQMTKSIKDNISYKVIYENQLVGNISVKDNHDSTYYLGCLCVIPKYQNKGIGQQAMRFLDNEFPDATAWSLVTPADNLRNCCFYEKAGFRITGEHIAGSVKLVIFEK